MNLSERQLTVIYSALLDQKSKLEKRREIYEKAEIEPSNIDAELAEIEELRDIITIEKLHKKPRNEWPSFRKVAKPVEEVTTEEKTGFDVVEWVKENIKVHKPLKYQAKIGSERYEDKLLTHEALEQILADDRNTEIHDVLMRIRIYKGINLMDRIEPTISIYCEKLYSLDEEENEYFELKDSIFAEMDDRKAEIIGFLKANIDG